MFLNDEFPPSFSRQFYVFLDYYTQIRSYVIQARHWQCPNFAKPYTTRPNRVRSVCIIPEMHYAVIILSWLTYQCRLPEWWISRCCFIKGTTVRIQISPANSMPIYWINMSNSAWLKHLAKTFYRFHDDVIKWKYFPRYLPLVRGIHRPPVNSPHKGQRRWTFKFSLICARINSWVKNRETGDLRCHGTHYDVIVILTCRVEPAPMTMTQKAKKYCVLSTALMSGMSQ